MITQPGFGMTVCMETDGWLMERELNVMEFLEYVVRSMCVSVAFNFAWVNETLNTRCRQPSPESRQKEPRPLRVSSDHLLARAMPDCATRAPPYEKKLERG